MRVECINIFTDTQSHFISGLRPAQRKSKSRKNSCWDNSIHGHMDTCMDTWTHPWKDTSSFWIGLNWEQRHWESFVKDSGEIERLVQKTFSSFLAISSYKEENNCVILFYMQNAILRNMQGIIKLISENIYKNFFQIKMSILHWKDSMQYISVWDIKCYRGYSFLFHHKWI